MTQGHCHCCWQDLLSRFTMMRKRGTSSTGPVTASSTGDYKGKPRRHVGVVSFSKAAVVAIVLFPLILLAFRRRGEKNDESTILMRGFVFETPPRKFTPVPTGHEKTFFYDGERITMPIVRSLRSRGWVRVNDAADAHMITTYSSTKSRFLKLKPWQRFSHIPGHGYWNDKASFIKVFKTYTDKTGIVPFYLPESYLLDEPEDRKAFEKRLKRKGGLDSPWVLKEPSVNQGRGITMLAPNSKDLLHVTDDIKKEIDEGARYIIQKYICDELTWNRRKFDVRMFWLVASFDPLIVLYHDGYVRIGNSEYQEDNFENTVAHLTTHTGLGEEGKATFDDLSNRIIQHHAYNPQLGHIRDPVQHIKNQFKHALAEIIVAFKDVSFTPTSDVISAENGFGFYGADYALDNDLDVWLIEPQKGCGLDEDYKFRLDMHTSLFDGMTDILEEIWQKQEEGRPVLPLKNTGNWEVIYADGWRYEYKDYKRSSNKKGCSDTSKASTKH